MGLTRYIEELKSFERDLPKIIIDIGIKNARGIISIQNDRLFQGYDSNYNLIGGGVYAKRTIANKKRLGHKYDVVTLLDTGGWYSDMFIGSDANGLLIDNKDADLTEKLMYGGGKFQNPPYGNAIIGLTDEEEQELTNNIIDPLLQSIIDEQISIGIEL